MATLRAAALGAATALLLSPAIAEAGTVTGGLSLSYTAADGEVNQLTVTRAGDDIVFTETGGLAIADAAATCEPAGPGAVRCAAVPAPAAIEIALGDGNDTL